MPMHPRGRLCIQLVSAATPVAAVLCPVAECNFRTGSPRKQVWDAIDRGERCLGRWPTEGHGSWRVVGLAAG